MLSYLGFNEFNEQAGITINIKKYGSVFIVLNKNGYNKILPLSVNVYEKYELIKRVSKLIKNKKECSLDVIVIKRLNNGARNK